jgi:hypothetical protein
VATPAATKTTRPGLLTAVAITGMALGIIRVGWVAYMFAIGRIMALQTSLFEKQPGSALRDLQLETYRQMRQASEMFVSAHSGVFLSAVLFGAILVLGGIGCLKLWPRYRWLALVGFLGLLGGDLLVAPAEIAYQRTVSDLNVALMSKTFELANQINSGALRTMSAMSTSMQRLSLYMAIGWSGLRVGICAACAYYLARRTTKQVFEPAPASPAAI